MINAWGFIGPKGSAVERARRILDRAPHEARYYRHAPIGVHCLSLADLQQALKDYRAIQAAEDNFLNRMRKSYADNRGRTFTLVELPEPELKVVGAAALKIGGSARICGYTVNDQNVGKRVRLESFHMQQRFDNGLVLDVWKCTGDNLTWPDGRPLDYGYFAPEHLEIIE